MPLKRQGEPDRESVPNPDLEPWELALLETDSGQPQPRVVYDTEGAPYVRDDDGLYVESCCDGTGWTGNPRTPCPDHYDPPDWPMTHGYTPDARH